MLFRRDSTWGCPSLAFPRMLYLDRRSANLWTDFSMMMFLHPDSCQNWLRSVATTFTTYWMPNFLYQVGSRGWFRPEDICRIHVSLPGQCIKEKVWIFYALYFPSMATFEAMDSYGAVWIPEWWYGAEPSTSKPQICSEFVSATHKHLLY